MSDSIAQALDKLPASTRAALSRHGFQEALFMELAERLRRGLVDQRFQGVVEPPAPGDIARLEDFGSAERAKLEELGRAALGEGRCALVVLAGGMATRMGGVVKALVEALPGRSFIDLRLAAQSSDARCYGSRVPLWLMTSYATDEPIRRALGSQVNGAQLATFEQRVSLRLTPSGELFLDKNGEPSLYAPGHGDLPDALQQSGLLEQFVARGGRALLVTNLDNLGGTIDPMILGFHLQHGQPVTSEVVDKLASDRGGIPIRIRGQTRAFEEFRLPREFDPKRVGVFNTNVFHFDARALLELDMEWQYVPIEKQLGGERVIQFERILNEITGALTTRFLHVPRSGAGARFLPCKDVEELGQRRPEIEAVARARGMLEP
ncbi:MAG TPA: UTP--glucose-1-phosphate uridylyltransferase [Polyangiaceae bacterium]|jgi:UTP--glucose-1-phosphate uridylyltransferase